MKKRECLCLDASPNIASGGRLTPLMKCVAPLTLSVRSPGRFNADILESLCDSERSLDLNAVDKNGVYLYKWFPSEQKQTKLRTGVLSVRDSVNKNRWHDVSVFNRANFAVNDIFSVLYGIQYQIASPCCAAIAIPSIKKIKDRSTDLFTTLKARNFVNPNPFLWSFMLKL